MFRPILSLVLGGLALAAATTPALAERSVALVLDASGSMNGRLPDKTAKIDAAKAAVGQFVAAIGDDVRLSFRAYGHQKHRSKHDCKDTKLIVPFGAAKDQRGAVVDSANGLKAQGYTPISYVLGLAADDLKGEAGDERVIVLVSDGKETCEGDPCLLALKLAEADASLTIHAIGFDVDYQARTQLQCIAKAGRGSYLDASSADELAASLTEVAEAEIEDEEIVVIQPKAETGKLKIIGPYFNEVVDAETGEMVTKITDSNNDVDLPPGIYNVRFGKSLWLKSVEIISGETTEINPGRLRVVGPYFNDVLDPETGALVEKATDSHNDFPLLAGRYDVMFGKAPWRGVEIREGETTVLNPGRLKIVGPYFNEIVDAETGDVVEKATDSHAEFPLPPGTYDVVFGKAVWRGFEIREGETTTVEPGRLKMADPYFNQVRDPETGEAVEKLTDSHNDMPLPPGEYDVHYGGELTERVVLKAGETVDLNPGRVKIEKDGSFFYELFDGAGLKVIKLTSGTNDIPVPAGDYTLDVDGQKVPLKVAAGKRKVVKVK